MKKMFTVLALMAILSSASPVAVFADEPLNAHIESNNILTGTNTATGTGTAIVTGVTGGTGTGIGGNSNVTFTYNQLQQLLGISFSNTPSAQPQVGDYGHSVTEISMEQIIKLMPRWSASSVQIMIESMENSSYSWSEVNGNILYQPTIVGRVAKLSNDEPIIFYSGMDSFGDPGCEMTLIGTVTYSAKPNAKNKVLPMHFLARAQAMTGKGANVAIMLNASIQKRFLSSVKSAGLGSGVSTLLTCLTGGLVSGSIGGSKGVNEYEATPGVTFLLLHVDRSRQIAAVANPKAVEKEVCDASKFLALIKFHLGMTTLCPDPCGNNQLHRKGAGDAYAGAFDCTGEKKYLVEAINQYEISLRDFQNGWEPKKGKNGAKSWTRESKVAQELARNTRWNMFWCILKLNGQEAAIAYGQKNKMTEGPTTYAELR